MTYIKDSKGQYVKVEVPKPEPVPSRTDVSIDSLLNKGLLAIERTMRHIVERSVHGVLERSDVQNLKDLMVLLQELKEKEDDILNKMTDEELEKIANAD
jgi:hypothetical protein